MPLRTFVTLGALAFPLGVFAQVPERHLPARPLARIAEAFSDIVGMRELSDGRLIVLDGQEQRLAAVDMVAGTVRPIGRHGQGPGEYGHATRLVALPGDTTWVVDVEGRRVLVIGPDAATRDVITGFGQVATDSGLTPATIRGADAAGRLYFPGRGGHMTRAGPEQADSVPVFQLDRAGGGLVVLTKVAAAKARINLTMAGKVVKAVEIVRPPFAVGDEWEVAADGRVVVARREPYRLEIAAPGRPVVHGPLVPTAALPISEADKAEYVANLPNAAAVNPTSLPWPETMPVFLARAVVVAPRGETWVRRASHAGATTAQYDVFDVAGRLVAALMVPATNRIVLATTRGVYVARSDDDGLQYIERYGPLR